MPAVFDQTITLVYVDEGAVDANGTPTTAEVERTSSIGTVQQRSTREVRADRDQAIGQYIAYFPFGPMVDRLGMVVASGKTYIVTGTPYAPRNDHWEVPLQLTEG